MDGTLLGKKYDLMNGGGGGGTSDYEELSNLPKINSVELKGNKSLDDLSIQGKLTFDDVPTESSNNPVKSGGVFSALPGIATAAVAGLVKPDGSTITVDANGVISAGSGITLEVFDNTHLLHQSGITLSKTKTMTANAWAMISVIGMAGNVSFQINNTERLWIDGYYFRDVEFIPVYNGDTLALSAAADGSDDNLMSSIILVYGLAVPPAPNRSKSKSKK